MKILSMPAASSVYVPDYIFKDGTIMVPITNYPYKGFGDTGNTFNGTVAIDGQYLKLSMQSGGNTGYTSFITDEIDLTNVLSISLFRSSSASGPDVASMCTISELQNEYVATTPAVVISSNNATFTLDVSSLTGKHRFCIKFHRNVTTTGSVNFGTIAINKA